MKQIKFSDLSVGDWVEVGDGLKVQVVYPRGRHDLITVRFLESQIVQAITISETTVTIDQVKAIPITPEFLKDNGFYCAAVGDSGPATPKKYYMRYEKWVCEMPFRTLELFFDRMTKQYRLQGFNGVNFTGVHTLQHLLRLAGIDEQIKL